MKKEFSAWGALLVIGLIRTYQKTLSLDHGVLKGFFRYGYCRFHPTCSEYAVQALQRYGFWKGLYLGTRRVIRCHPWSPGGHDPVI